MENTVASAAQREQVAAVMLPARAADDVVDLHPPPHVRLRPPADGAGAELRSELLEQELVIFR
jgi:hypothetical protein